MDTRISDWWESLWVMGPGGTGELYINCLLMPYGPVLGQCLWRTESYFRSIVYYVHVFVDALRASDNVHGGLSMFRNSTY